VNESKNVALLFEVSLLLTAVFLGTNMVAVKYAVVYIPPLLLVAIRFALGGLLLWGLLFVPIGVVLPNTSHLWRLFEVTGLRSILRMGATVADAKTAAEER
jgi:drug/metabolite transporter (DMT)-like permease